MKQRIITGFVFALAMAASVIPGYWSIWPPVVLIVVVALIISTEITTALRHCGLRPCFPMVIAGSLLCLLPLAVRYVQPRQSASLIQSAVSLSITLFALLVFMAAGSIVRLLIDGPSAFPDAIATGASIVYIAFPLTCAITMLSHLDGGWLWLIIGLSAPWVSDTFAFFSGSLFGRHLIVPSLSPKKTLEGSIGGIVGSMLSQLLIFYLFRHFLSSSSVLLATSLLFALFSGLLLSIASQLGDWLASGFKRYCSIKDFGHILPGHGGLLDRFDSAFFTLPMTMLLAILFQFIGS